MMPFSAEFDKLYASIKQTAKEIGFRCQRADDIWEDPAIIQDIVSLIDRSSVVICDCTGRNANVFFEMGVAHTLGRDVILLAQSEADIPFDVSHLRHKGYLNNDGGLVVLNESLRNKLQRRPTSSIKLPRKRGVR